MTSGDSRPTLPKSERMVSRRLIDSLFAGGKSQSAVVYPVRVVYRTATPAEGETAAVQLMVSVSKRHFKRAVKRNRVKRQLREAYRHNKTFAWQATQQLGKHLYIAFVWQSDRLYTSGEVEQSVRTLLQRVGERICRNVS